MLPSSLLYVSPFPSSPSSRGCRTSPVIKFNNMLVEKWKPVEITSMYDKVEIIKLRSWLVSLFSSPWRHFSLAPPPPPSPPRSAATWPSGQSRGSCSPAPATQWRCSSAPEAGSEGLEVDYLIMVGGAPNLECYRLHTQLFYKFFRTERILEIKEHFAIHLKGDSKNHYY